MNLLIINTGGTFNKVYNHIDGELVVPKNSNAIENIIKSFSSDINFQIVGTVFKDSLEMNEEDREDIYQTILSRDEKDIIIIHGTDTMDLTAKYLSERVKDRVIILTGAMYPLSISPTDGAMNFGVALGFLQSVKREGIYISMSGIVDRYNNIYKNREMGVFNFVN